MCDITHFELDYTVVSPALKCIHIRQTAVCIDTVCIKPKVSGYETLCLLDHVHLAQQLLWLLFNNDTPLVQNALHKTGYNLPSPAVKFLMIQSSGCRSQIVGFSSLVKGNARDQRTED